MKERNKKEKLYLLLQKLSLLTAASQAYYIITFVISLKKSEAAILYNLTGPDNSSLDCISCYLLCLVKVIIYV